MPATNPILIPYLRKSGKEDPAISRDRQRRAIEVWASANGVELAAEVWEPGVSGSRPWQERGLGDAIARCVAGEADGIIVEEQSRLSRARMIQTAEVWDAFQSTGLRLVCTADGIDTTNGDHELSFAVRAALAREEWKKYARRIEHVKKNAIARGVHIAAQVAVGYRRPGRGLPLEKDGRAGDAITAAFKLRATGASIVAVRELLDKRLPGGPSGHGCWMPYTVNRLLKNRAYLGEARQGKHVNADAHPALVDVETFDAVQALSRRAEPRPDPQGDYLLTGLVRCASCGYSMYRTKGSAGHFNYKCRGRSAGHICESPVSASAPALERLVADAFFARVEAELESDLVPVPVRADVDAIHAQIAAKRNHRATFEDGEVWEKLGKEACLRAIEKIDAELDALEAELAEAIPLAKPSAQLDRVALLESRDTLSVGETRELIGAALDGVVVSRAPRGTLLAERVDLRWFDDGRPPLARPSRRPKVEAGMAPA
jgi:DNA invertase Pin-like site-specific DNA recombinase